MSQKNAENVAASSSLDPVVIREFSTWAKTECDRCGCEFQVTRTEPKKIEGEAICGDCETYELGYNDGFKAGRDSQDESIQRLRGQLQNCINHLDRAKRKMYGLKVDDCIESANKCLSETLDA